MGHAKSTIAHRELFASLLVTIVICCLTSAKAQIIYVDSAPPEPYCVNITCGTSVCPCWSIQNAIDQVPYNSTTYEVLVMPGTYRGEKNTNITFAGKQLTLRSTNGSESTFIECNPLFTVGFMFYSGEQRTSQVKGFTLNYCFLVITNASSPYFEDVQLVGVLDTTFDSQIKIAHQSWPYFYNSTMTQAGTAQVILQMILVADSNITMDSCYISSNQRTIHAGGESPFISLINSVFENNTPTKELMLIVDSFVEIVNCTFMNNVILEKSTVFAYNSTIIARNSTWINNIGHSIVLYQTTPSLNCEVIIEGCIFDRNIPNAGAQVLFGGAVQVYNAHTYISNSKFISNVAALGGGVFVEGALDGLLSRDFTLENSLFFNNSAKLNPDNTVSLGDGGAVAVFAMTNNMINCSITGNNFTQNSAGHFGGAIRISGNSTGNIQANLNENLFENNSALLAGAMFSSASINITNCEFIENHSSSIGGAIVSDDGHLEVYYCVFQNNTALNYGGAIHGASDDSLVFIFHSEFESNTGSYGGAIHLVHNISSTISNCSFVGNIAADHGGAISITNGVADVRAQPIKPGIHFLRDEELSQQIHNCSFTGNFAQRGGAISGESGSSPWIQDCWISGNSAEYGAGIFLDEQSSGVLLSTRIVANTANHGGGFLSYGNATSSLRNCSFENNLATVQGGGAVLDGNSLVQLVNVQFIDNHASDSGGGISLAGYTQPNFDHCTFSNNSAARGAGILCSQNSRPSFIACTISENIADTFGGGVMFADKSRGFLNDSLITNNTALEDGGGILVIGESSPGIFNNLITHNFGYHGGGISINSPSSFFITSCQITGNYAKTRGGGIKLSGISRPSIDDCVLEGNYGVDGAAISVADDSNPFISNSIFRENTGLVQAGAAIIADWSTPRFENCSFYTNAAHTGSGGAASILDFSVPEFESCNFVGNQAAHGGGVYCVSAFQPSFKSCNFTGNSAEDEGGAISIHGISKPLFHQCYFQFNVALGTGGAVNCADQSTPYFYEANFFDNIATSGGAFAIQGLSDPFIISGNLIGNVAIRGAGIYVASRANGFSNSSVVTQGVAILGGGFYLSNNASFYAWNTSISENLAINAGGGIGMEATTHSVFENCFIFDNYALKGGGIYIYPMIQISPDILDIQIGGPEHPNPLQDTKESESHQFTFLNVAVTGNHAHLGGGVFIRESTFGFRVSFDTFSSVTENVASQFGGGVYFSGFLANLTVFYGSLIMGNSAEYGGGSVAWEAVSEQNFGNHQFCLGCQFVNNSSPGGYQNLDGFCTPPMYMEFIANHSCPESVYLVNVDGFNLGVQLLDYFGTRVRGNLLIDSQFNVSVAAAESTCILTPSEMDMQFSSDGEVFFPSAELQSKNGSICMLLLTSSELTELITLPINSIQELNCNITVANCTDDYVVSHQTTYDTCVKATFWSTYGSYVWVFILLFLLMITIFLLALQLTLYMNKRRANSWGKSIVVPNLESKPEVTLQSILSDPSIPHIPWEQLEIKEKIGAGAAAIVSRGYWTVDGTATEVALKQLYLSAQQLSPDMLKDFLVEIKLTSALHHANVVRLIGISCSPELDLYLVAELMHRGSIRDVLDQKKDNLRWDIRLKLLLDAAKGMSYLHSRSVIHRDLKPRNLLVSKNWVCKVADFGASTISATSKTMTFIGTPAYMAPEVLAHTKYSEKADVFAFGVILVEVYTGNPPYTGEEFDSIRNQAQLIYQITKKNLRPSTDELPPALAHLIHDCWSEDPELRPSFSEIIVRLRRLRSLQLPSYSRVRLRSRRESGEFSSDMDFPGDLDAIRLHDLSHGKQSRLDLDPVAIDDMILEPNSGPSIEEQELEREARANLNSLTRSEQRLYSDPTARTFDNRRAQKLSLPL